MAIGFCGNVDDVFLVIVIVYRACDHILVLAHFDQPFLVSFNNAIVVRRSNRDSSSLVTRLPSNDGATGGDCWS